MKNIAIYCIDFFPSESGYSFAFQNLIKGIADNHKDIAVDVFTPIELLDKDELNFEQVNVFRLLSANRFRKIRYLRFFWSFFVRPWMQARVISKAFLHKRYDFLLFESLDDPLVLYFLPAYIKKKVIVRIHATSETEYVLWAGGLVQRFKRILITKLLQKDVKCITATCDYYLEFAKKWFLLENKLLSSDKRYCTIPNSIEISNFVPIERHKSQGRYEFLTLGRMDILGTNQKGFDDILMAIILLPNSIKNIVSFTIVGKGSERDRLMRIASKINLVKFKFIESLPNTEVSKLLFSSDCVILASRYEGMSIFAMESLAHSCPIIFSDTGGIAEFVDKNGYLFSPGNSQELSESICKISKMSFSELRELGDISANLISKYSPENSAKRLIDFSKLIE